MLKRSWLCFFLLVPSSLLFGQSAELSGVVKDPTGANVPNATVELRNQDTGVRQQTTTNREGVYSLPGLKPGKYVATVQAQGFKTLTRETIVLNVAERASMDFSLQVGSASETVTVTGGAPLVNTMDGSVSTVVDQQFAENLPMNGRSFQALLTLVPGVVLTKASFAEQGQFSVNGQRPDANYFTVDGVSANVGVNAGFSLIQSAGGALPGFTVQGGTNSLVSVDAMQEFRVQTSTFAPEFGRTPGGQVSIVTRSGTNAFHGTLFEYFRNDVLDANDWFNNALNLKKPAERQNDFGGVLGGPIVKNRTFFFFSYEGLRLRQPQTRLIVVPSGASRTAAPAQIQPFLNAYPAPNGPDRGGGTAQFAASYSDPSTLNATSIRLDHALNSKLTVFGRYNYAPSEAVQRGAGDTLSALTTTRIRTQTGTLGLTYGITPHVSNEIRANYSTETGSNRRKLDTFGAAAPLSLSSVYPSSVQPQDSSMLFNIIGVGFWRLGRDAENEQRQINVVDNLSLVMGSHQLKFGVDYRRLSPISSPQNYSQVITFSGLTGPTGALSGRAASVSVQAFRRVVLFSTNFSAYAQDTWKVKPRLSLTYGLRWDVNPAMRGKSENMPFALEGIDSPATISLAPAGTPLYRTSYRNFTPRVGATYQARQSGWETVMRGGVGIFFDLGSGFLGALTGGFPFTGIKPLSSVPYPLTPDQAAPPAFSSGPPVGSITAPDPNLKLPRTYQWNFALQQSLGTNQTVSATYVGAIGRRLLRQESFFGPNPNFQPNALVRIMRNTATSNYHALQAQYNRRLSHSLQALASYTWSHSVDDASSDADIFAAVGFVNPRVDRGSSDFDIRHSLTGAVSYDLPSPAWVGKAFLRGWSVDTFLLARSATPRDLIGGSNFVGFFSSLRPDVVPGIAFYLFDPSFAGGKRFNNTVDPSRPGCKGPFCPPPSGRQGTLGRNVLRGFGAWQMDFALRRQFHLTERLNLQFRAEFFNIFNHPNFGDPVNNLSNPLFGQSTQTLARSLGGGGISGGFNPLYQIGAPRSIQLALKLVF